LGREARRAGLQNEAGDPRPALLLVAPRENDAPLAVVSIGDEDLAAVEHPLVAAPLGAALNRAGRIRAAERLVNGEERPPALADRGHRVLFDLRLGPRPDRRRRIATEHAATRA